MSGFVIIEVAAPAPTRMFDHGGRLTCCPKCGEQVVWRGARATCPTGHLLRLMPELVVSDE